MLSSQERKDIFAKADAIITGEHFVYAKKETGWFHGSDYVNKDAIYPYEDYVSILCRDIAEHFGAMGVETVVGPTVGAVRLSSWTCHWLNSWADQRMKVLDVCADEEDVLEQKEVPVMHVREFNACGRVEIRQDQLVLLASFSEKVGTRRVIKRGYDKHVKGKRCLIVEDVINSGITVVKTRDAVLTAGGEVIGVGALCNRSGGKVTAETLMAPELLSLLDLDMQMYPEDECPICKERGLKSVRIDLGKGKEFLARKGLA